MKIEKDNVPMHWYSQLQYQLGVAELEQGALAWLIAGREFDYLEVEFDKEFFDYMVGEVDKFWIDNIKGGKEPISMNLDDVVLRNPRHVLGKFVEADATIMQEIAEMRLLKEELAKLDARKKEIEDNIKMMIGDAEALVAPGSTQAKPQVLATWKNAKDSTKFDEKLFAKENPDTYAKYQYTTSGSRRFLLK